MKDFNFTLQIKGEENKVIGNIVQNDTANRFIIRLRDGISPVVLDETDIVTVTYKRSNDSVVVDAMGGGSITVADFNAGEIVIVPDAAAVTNVGMVNATVEVYDGTGHKLSSARFSFTVTPDLVGHADASTDSSFPALQNLISLLAVKNDSWENAEAQRVANENVRVTNEDGRVTAEQERARVWAQLEEMCRELIEEMVSPDVEVKSNTPEEYILTITDKDGSFDTPNLKPGMGSGTGDMLMADYDPDKDGSVRMADNAQMAENAAKLAGHGADYFMPGTVTVTTAGTDLNDYTEDGFYFFPNSDYTPANIPVGVNGWLLVMGGGRYDFTKQLWWRAGTPDSNDYQCYQRMYYNGRWSAWTQTITDKGGVFTGNVTLSGDPISALQPATKQYVDEVKTTANNAMPKAGSDFTGLVRYSGGANAVVQASRYCFRNIYIVSADNTAVTTGSIKMWRK